MHDILNFFLEPYQNVPIQNIILEIIAATLGVASVIFAKKENILVFPTGIISTSIYIYLLSQWNLYGDLIINIYYTVMSIYGWYMWTRIVDEKFKKHLPISRTNKKEKLIATAIFLSASAFVIFIYRHYNVMPNNLNFFESAQYAYQNLSSGNLEQFRKAVPFLDTFTTAAAFVGMWLMAIKKIENWTFWIATNLVSIPLYFVKGYGFTGIQYLIFLILAIQGYKEWKKILNKKKQTS
jgi:nicotinamide mononucleotide transporter